SAGTGAGGSGGRGGGPGSGGGPTSSPPSPLTQILDEVEATRSAGPRLTSLASLFGVPLWNAGPPAPLTYGTPGPDTVKVEIRAAWLAGASHANAVIGEPGKPGFQRLALEVNKDPT